MCNDMSNNILMLECIKVGAYSNYTCRRGGKNLSLSLKINLKLTNARNLMLTLSLVHYVLHYCGFFCEFFIKFVGFFGTFSCILF